MSAFRRAGKGNPVSEVAAVTPAVADRGLMTRIFGVLLAPRETYAGVAAHPRAWGVLAVVIAIVAGGQFLLMSSEVGQQMVLDQQIRTMESFGMNISDEMYARMEEGVANARYTTAGSQLVFTPLVNAIVGGLVLVVFTMLLGGAATFKQTFAVAAHASVIVAVQQIFSLPLSYASGEFAGANLAVFAPMLEETSFAVRFLGAIDLFLVWWVFSLSVGIAVLYRRRTGGIFTSLMGVYLAIALILAIVRSGS